LIETSSKLSNKNIFDDENFPLILWNISVCSQSFNLTVLGNKFIFIESQIKLS
jgi:hypothetical protein